MDTRQYITEDEEARGGYRRSARLERDEIDQLAKAATSGKGNRKERRAKQAQFKKLIRSKS